ncbi:unnamed protein product [Paramecium sonneborni]|uniref:Uncharacterized protein n=1 Tax=Paramecium sonneborni TaxID=65129 RepID=A0A8S1RV59_9CILI|nr:unnamed protein product [Paramecium sonneborni]
MYLQQIIHQNYYLKILQKMQIQNILIKKFDYLVLFQQINIMKKQYQFQMIFQNKMSFNNQFQKMNQTKKSFSHELRTPFKELLIIYLFYKTLLILKQLKINIQFQHQIQAKIQSYLISDLIDFTSSNTKNLEYLIKEFSMRYQLMKLLHYLLVDPQDCCTTTVTSDYTKLMQILVNSLQNSIKFLTEQFIFLKIQSHTKEILKFTVSYVEQGLSCMNITQIQSYLNNLENQKEIQLYNTWQGLGLLISAMLVSKEGPFDKSKIKFESMELI